MQRKAFKGMEKAKGYVKKDLEFAHQVRHICKRYSQILDPNTTGVILMEVTSLMLKRLNLICLSTNLTTDKI
jgi:hypothetical protein